MMQLMQRIGDSPVLDVAVAPLQIRRQICLALGFSGQKAVPGTSLHVSRGFDLTACACEVQQHRSIRQDYSIV